MRGLVGEETATAIAAKTAAVSAPTAAEAPAAAPATAEIAVVELVYEPQDDIPQEDHPGSPTG